MTDWSNFLRDARRHSQNPGGRCHVGQLLESLTPDAQKAIRRAIGDKTIPASAIAKALADRLGESRAPSRHSVSSHRRGGCRCKKD